MRTKEIVEKGAAFFVVSGEDFLLESMLGNYRLKSSFPKELALSGLSVALYMIGWERNSTMHTWERKIADVSQEILNNIMLFARICETVKKCKQIWCKLLWRSSSV